MVDQLSRRRLLRQAALLLATASVSACSVKPSAIAGNPTARPVSTASPPSVPAANKTVPPSAVEISIWGEKSLQYKPLAAQFKTAHPQINATVTSAPSAQYHDQLIARMAANDPPDMAMIVDTEFMRFFTSKFVSDLTSYVRNEPGWNISAPGYTWFYSAITDFFKPSGKPYAIPISVNPIGIGFNIDLFKSRGIPTPYDRWKQGTWTWDTFLQTAHQMTSGQGDTKVWGYTGTANLWNLAIRIWQNGGDIFNSDRTKVVVDQPAAYEAIQWYFDLNLKQGVAPANLRSADANFSHWFPNSRAAMIDADTNTRFTLKGTQISWGVAPQPKKVGYASWTGGSGYTLPTHAKRPDDAWAFISYASSEAGARLLMQQGAAASAVIKAMESPDFLRTPPQYVETFLDMLKTAHPEPFITQNQQYLDIWNKQMDIVASGKQTARDAATEIKRQVEPLLTPTG